MSQENAIVTIKHASKSFFSSKDHATSVFEDFNLVVKDGQFVCILGPSGCGKTTLLRCIADLEPLTSGTISLSSRLANDAPPIGLVFQRPTLLPWLSVLDNISLPSISSYYKKRRDLSEQASDLLSMVGLSGFGSYYPYQLSGGMQQRVAIARALVSNPQLMLMDEPFGALDDLTRRRLNLELTRIAREVRCAVVLITHSIYESVVLADRIIILDDRPTSVLLDFSIDIPHPRTRTMLNKYATRVADVTNHIENTLGIS